MVGGASPLVSRALIEMPPTGGPSRRLVAEAPGHPRLRNVLVEPHRAFRSTGHPDGLVLASSTAVPLVLNLAEPQHRPAAFVLGPQTVPLALHGGPSELYLEAWLDPVAAAGLLRVSMQSLRGGVAPLADLAGPAGRDLPDRMRDTPHWHERFRLLDRFLQQRRDGAGAVPPQVAHGWRLLTAHRGRIPVSRLADQVGWSQQHLADRFHHHLGMPLKKAARVLRVEDVLRAAAREPGTSWADLAARFDFADQAHLTREVRSLLGVTPSALRPRRPPIA
jgi:AraC-like DNA-binding protein